MATSSLVMCRFPFSVLLKVAADHPIRFAACSRLNDVCCNRTAFNCAPMVLSRACGFFL
nr:hypothetical protein [Actinokineospora pegani]